MSRVICKNPSIKCGLSRRHGLLPGAPPPTLKHPPGLLRPTSRLAQISGFFPLLDRLEPENDFFRREDPSEKPLEHDRLDVDEEIHPFQHGEVAEIEPFFQHVESSRAAIVGPVTQLPFLVEFQPPFAQVLIVIERPDAKRDPVVRLAIILGAKKKWDAHFNLPTGTNNPIQLSDNRVEVLEMLQDM